MKKFLLLAIISLFIFNVQSQNKYILGAGSLKLGFQKNDIFQLLSYSVDTAQILYNAETQSYSINDYNFSNDKFNLTLFFYNDKLMKFILHKKVDNKNYLYDFYKSYIDKYEYKYGKSEIKNDTSCKWVDYKTDNSILIYYKKDNNRIVIIYTHGKLEKILDSLKINDI